MIYFPLLFLATSGLLARTSFAIPMPVLTGQVVAIAPDKTLGVHNGGQGSYIPHPHIVLGNEPGTGNVVLAPVTHGTDERNGPMMKNANALHPDLDPDSNILLHHVTADPTDVPNHPIFNGRLVDHGALQVINNAKLDAAKDIHLDAKDAHKEAAKDHESAAKAHDRTAKKYEKYSESPTLVKDHRDKAQVHRDKAQEHLNTAAGHRQEASNANKPVTYPEYKTVLDSKNAASRSALNADDSKDHAKAAGEHLKAMVALNKAAGDANKHDAEKFNTKSNEHFQAAQQHAPSSPNKPDADDSRKAAKKDLKKAEKATKSNKKAKH